MRASPRGSARGCTSLHKRVRPFYRLSARLRTLLRRTLRARLVDVALVVDRYGDGKRPSVRLTDADVVINVHISDNRVTLSLDSSGESLHKRGWRAAQTEAPINEVLAAGILAKAGWDGQSVLIDPMCGSGTFLVEAALMAKKNRPGRVPARLHIPKME